MLTPQGCRARQHRLLQEMVKVGWDLFLTANPRTVYYLSSVFQADDSPAIFLLRADGTSTVLSNADATAATHWEKIETYSLHPCITHPAHDAARFLAPGLRQPHAKVCGVELSRTAGLFEELLTDTEIADATGRCSWRSTTSCFFFQLRYNLQKRL